MVIEVGGLGDRERSAALVRSAQPIGSEEHKRRVLRLVALREAKLTTNGLVVYAHRVERVTGPS